MREIERKFLVTSQVFKKQHFTSKRIVQGYLSNDPERTVRVRIKGDEGYLTIKGKSNDSGTTRMEWEKEIGVADATELLQLCLEGTIDKIRYEIKAGKHIIEVDEFFGKNEGLVIAEIELDNEDEAFEKPEWLGEEVTGDRRYYNSYLGANPYTTWP